MFSSCVSQMQSFQGNHCYLISLMCHLHSCGARLDVGTHKTKYHNPCACKPRIINSWHTCATRVTVVVVSVCVCAISHFSLSRKCHILCGQRRGQTCGVFSETHALQRSNAPTFHLCMHACITQMHIIMYIPTQI